MRVLVTGAAGVIGSRITHRLVEAGHAVIAWDACEAPRNEWNRERLPMCGFVRGRIEHTDPGTVASVVGDVNAVIHAAASTGIPYSTTAPLDDWERNTGATLALLEALRRDPKPTVVLSSVKPYAVPADIVDRGGLREGDPLLAHEPYAASKASQAHLCTAYASSYGVPVVTYRCSNLTGPGAPHGRRHGWATWFCVSAAIGKPIVVQGDGTQSRDLLHADDVFSACMVGLENAWRMSGRVFNIGGGKDNRISVRELAEQMRERTGVSLESGPSRQTDDLHVFADYGALNMETGWEPKVGVRENVDDVLSWATRNRDTLAALYREE